MTLEAVYELSGARLPCALCGWALERHAAWRSAREFDCLGRRNYRKPTGDARLSIDLLYPVPMVPLIIATDIIR